MNEILERFVKDTPVFETDRLIFRPIRQDDAEDMYGYACDGEVTKYLLWSEHPDIGFTRRYIKRIGELYRQGEYYDWAAVRKSDRKMIGTAGFAQLDMKNGAGEIGYVLARPCWHQGYGTEMAKALIDFGFSYFGFNRIQARYMKENVYSRSVMDKCGMRFEGILREALFVKGEYRDIGVCSILRSEYLKDHELKVYQAGRRPFHIF